MRFRVFEKQLNYKQAVRQLNILISQIRDLYLQEQLNQWVEDNLHTVVVSHTTSPEVEKDVPDGYFDHYVNDLLQRKLTSEVSTVANFQLTEYAGFPRTKIRELSMMVVGKK